MAAGGLVPSPGELILYVDESGEHGMTNIDPSFPILTIAGCAFDDSAYFQFQRDVANFKASIGNPNACLHSRDIRKWEADFAAVAPGRRDQVMSDISAFMSRARFTLITVTIHKDRLAAMYRNPNPPYNLAIEYLLERFYSLLQHTGKKGTVYAESRGRREDALVADVYSKFRTNGFRYASAVEVQRHLPGRIQFGFKVNRSVGLEAADLAAYPVARYVLDPMQANRAFEVLRPKLYAGTGETSNLSIDSTDGMITVGSAIFLDRPSYDRSVRRYGLKTFP